MKCELRGYSDINSYLLKLAEEYNRLSIAIVLSGHYNALGPVYQNELTLFGINADSYQKGGVFIIEKGNFLFYSPAGTEYHYICKFGERDMLVDLARGMQLGTTRLQLAENGISLLIYDPITNFIIDNVKVNIYDGLSVMHTET